MTDIQYRKELYSLPVEIIEVLSSYAKETKQKKSHIISDALVEYITRNKRKKLAQEAKGLIGLVSSNSPDIQNIKANRYD